MLQIYVEAERRANLFAVPGRHSICGDAGHTMIFHNFEAGNPKAQAMDTQQRLYPLGRQDFAEIRTAGNFLYVDKTEYVYRMTSFDRETHNINSWKIQ